MILHSSSVLLSSQGMQPSWWRPSHTAKAFFQGCRHRAWILAPLFSREDTSPLDAVDTLSALMLNGMPDSDRFLNLLGNLIVAATEAAKGKHPRVSVFGEYVHLLWARGNAEGAIQFEKLGNQLAENYDVDILCGYSLGCVEVGIEDKRRLYEPFPCRLRAYPDHPSVAFVAIHLVLVNATRDDASLISLAHMGS
jgi:hypothetical protein